MEKVYRIHYPGNVYSVHYPFSYSTRNIHKWINQHYIRKRNIFLKFTKNGSNFFKITIERNILRRFIHNNQYN